MDKRPSLESEMEVKKARSRASLSMVLGIASLFLTFVTGFFGLLLGWSSLRILRRNDATAGKGVAVAGIIISILFSLISGSILFSIGWFYLAISNDVTSSKNLKLITLSFHNYEDRTRRLPTDHYSDDNKALLSWRVMVLEHLDEKEQELFKKFNLNEPWNSPQNLEAAKEMPDVFNRPGCRLPTGLTVYKRPFGECAMFDFARPRGKEPGIRFSEIYDGLNNTIMLVECQPEDAVFWTQPNTDYAFDPENPGQGLGASQLGTLILGMGDTSVRSLAPNTVGDDNLRAAFTKNLQDSASR